MRLPMRPTLLLTLATVTAAALSGCNGLGPDPGTDDAPTQLRVAYEATGSGTDGFLLLRLANPAGLSGGIDLDAHLRLADLVPVQVTLIAPDGAVHQVLHGTEFDNAHYLQGDGVVHAGAGDARVVSPSLDDGSSQDIVMSRKVEFPALASAHVLVLWAGQDEAPGLRSVWAPGTVVEEVARGDVVQAELKDLRGGAHLGTPALGLNVADGITVTAGQVWGDVRVFRSNVAAGELGLTVDGERRVLDLQYGCSLTDCGSSYDVRRIHFSSEGGASLDATFAGNTRSTKVLATFALLPEAVLPSVYLEAEEAFP